MSLTRVHKRPLSSEKEQDTKSKLNIGSGTLQLPTRSNSMLQRPQTLSISSKGALRSAVFSAEVTSEYWRYFAFIVAAGFLMRLACFTGLIASDDLGYSHYAQLIAHLNYKPELHHFALRYGLIIPLAAVYRLFGLREWTTIIIPLLTSTLSVPAGMLIGQKLLGSRAALLGGFLIATFPVELHYATILVPEPVAELYVLVAILVYLHWGAENPVLGGLVSGVCIGVAYLTKEPALFIAPALMIDALATRRWRIFLAIAAGLLMIVGAEQTYYAAVTGDLMFRPHAMVQHNQSIAALEANQHLGWRLFKAYPRMMIVPSWSFGLHSLFAILLAIPACFLLSPEKWRLLVLWVLLPLIYLNFGTSSLTHYWALPAVDRYLLFIYPPLFMLSAEVLILASSLRSHAAPFLGLAVSFVIASGLYCGFANRAHGWRTDAVKELRTIAEAAERKQFRTVAFQGGPPAEWPEAMAILDHDLQPSTDSKAADITIGPDALGLPCVVSDRRP
jgi:4-amino-4-deoxy-L-arabinose transferase-like glycosyltransferase